MNAVLVGVSANRNHFSFDAAIIFIFNAIMLVQPGIFTEICWNKLLRGIYSIVNNW